MDARQLIRRPESGQQLLVMVILCGNSAYHQQHLESAMPSLSATDLDYSMPGPAITTAVTPGLWAVLRKGPSSLKSLARLLN